jgi:hypothetical protein
MVFLTELKKIKNFYFKFYEIIFYFNFKFIILQLGSLYFK